jgi:hypothetical protein
VTLRFNWLIDPTCAGHRQRQAPQIPASLAMALAEHIEDMRAPSVEAKPALVPQSTPCASTWTPAACSGRWTTRPSPGFGSRPKQSSPSWPPSVQQGTIALRTSEALEFEISRTPDGQRRREATAILTLARERLTLSDASERLADSFAQAGLSAIDALHVALASTAGADFFVTADDKLLRRAKLLPDLKITPISLLGLVSEIPQ